MKTIFRLLQNKTWYHILPSADVTQIVSLPIFILRYPKAFDTYVKGPRYAPYMQTLLVPPKTFASI